MKSILALLLLVFSLQAFGADEPVKVTVKGMTCASCAGVIERELRKLPEVESVEISVQAGTMLVSSRKDKAASADQLRKVIEDAGYSVVSIEGPKKAER